ncbi:MAG: TenA family protein, partial [Ramlibacter sp.]|nr:TenA family protein [Cryobacterium sp.]
APWFGAICDHPFVTGLADGTLDDDVFARYLLDDSHYLDRYARVLATLAARAPDVEGIALLAGSAAGAVAAERELHREFLAPRGLDPDADAVPGATPTCRAYTGSLESAAHGPFDVALAAVLPCFRVYAEVGRHVMSQRRGGTHPYAAWIDAYAAPEFAEAVRTMEAYTDGVASARMTSGRAGMLDAYTLSTRYEWMFWDAAWSGQGWPTAMTGTSAPR